MVTTEGIRHFMELVLQLQALPASYWLGWATNTSLSVSSTMASITELTGFGYARQEVAIEGSSLEIDSAAGGTNGWKMTFDDKTWAASGGDWSLALWCFITTVETGSSGKLIGAEPLNEGSGVALNNGQSYDKGIILLAEPMVS